MYLDTQRTIIVLTNRGPIRGHSRPTPSSASGRGNPLSTVEQRIAHQDFAVPPPIALADEVLFMHCFKHSGLELVLAGVGKVRKGARRAIPAAKAECPERVDSCPSSLAIRLRHVHRDDTCASTTDHPDMEKGAV
jgi:hypothetical protein